MSEYQYYEFQAIDRPLDRAAQAALRQITSRAEITATSLVNTYQWGDFKGSPSKLMEQYFDAFLYLANWGSRTVMLRLPRGALSLEEIDPYLLDDPFTASETKDHLILSFDTREEDGGDWEEDGPGCLAPLIPIRDELMRGDRRPLYLGWLLSVDWGYFDDEDNETIEPPVPPGLGSLTGPQQALAEFMRLDPFLLEAAAEASREAGQGPDPALAQEQAEWVKALPAEEKDGILLQVLRGEGQYLALELQRRFRDEQAGKLEKDRPPAEEGPPRRSIAQLRARAEELAEAEEKREQERKQRQCKEADRRKAEERKRHLDAMAGKEERWWSEVESLVATKQPGKYDEAVTVLRDLHELAQRSNTEAGFAARLSALRARHNAKYTFIQRLDKAGLP